MADPTPREVTDFDRSLKIGDQFRNRYQEHEHAAATRIIEITTKHPGNTIGYQVIEEHRIKQFDQPEKTMSTQTLLEYYEAMPILTGEENID